MKMLKALMCLWVISLVAVSTGVAEWANEANASGKSGDPYGHELGTVHFPTSCNEEAGDLVERGVALLHHMTYEGARHTFEKALQVDPDCRMALWGIGMSFIHPLWPDDPDEATLRRGADLVNQAKMLGKPTEREWAYIAALEAYYDEGWKRDRTARLASYEQAWRDVHEQFPDDPEASSFYALALMATASPSDKTYQKQLSAGSIAEDVLGQMPDHPGAHHYVIHAYDYPNIANRAQAVARNYGKIAPDVPHALHMPTHIFIRLGLWREAIEGNERSAAAALKASVKSGAISMHYLHALDYLAYSHLQRAEDEKAKAVLDRVMSLEGPHQELNRLVFAYAFAAIPARYFLERQRWSDAAQLETRQPSSFPWEDGFAQAEAITHFARALGMARSGDLDGARGEISRLGALEEAVAEKSAYWANQIAIQRLSAMAQLAFAEGEAEQSLDLMRAAARREASTHKHPITPGEVLPTRELLADLLLELGQFQEALKEYGASLERSPNRFNSLFGAGRAAELAGDARSAAIYYQRLVDMCSDADTGRKRLDYANAFLVSQRTEN